MALLQYNNSATALQFALVLQQFVLPLYSLALVERMVDEDRHDSLTTAGRDPEIAQEATLKIIEEIEHSLLPNACWQT